MERGHLPAAAGKVVPLITDKKIPAVLPGWLFQVERVFTAKDLPLAVRFSPCSAVAAVTW